MCLILRPDNRAYDLPKGERRPVGRLCRSGRVSPRRPARQPGLRSPKGRAASGWSGCLCPVGMSVARKRAHPAPLATLRPPCLSERACQPAEAGQTTGLTISQREAGLTSPAAQRRSPRQSGRPGVCGPPRSAPRPTCAPSAASRRNRR